MLQSLKRRQTRPGCVGFRRTLAFRIFFPLFVITAVAFSVWTTEAGIPIHVQSHRHQDDHKCEKLEVQKPRMAATKELVQKIIESKDGSKSKGRRGAKNSATAAKVALMKLKLHAAGDKGLPQTERTYFQVYLPKESKNSSQPMFFCSKWTVGKVVDYAASLASLKNNNNILTAKKLRLCHPQTGEAFRMDDTLVSLLAHPETPLYNGGNVILEYLDNECLVLEDVSEYIAQT
ncbi:uncharacterized protein V6R79_010247 [Siganus canaliculatus]